MVRVLAAPTQNAFAWFRSLFNKRIILPFLLLLASLFVDFVFLRTFFTELDILEHFLFGFIISEVVSTTANALGLQNRLVRESPLSWLKADSVIRLAGFLFLGGLLWESFELFFLPVFGVSYNPFFVFPITLHNIDGAVDVSVGILGCVLAWLVSKQMRAAKSNAQG